jgi:hypothetical protein
MAQTPQAGASRKSFSFLGWFRNFVPRALVGIFVVTLLVGAQSNKGQAGIIPTAPKSASAFDAKIIRVNQRPDKIAFPQRWAALPMADSLRHGELDVETNFRRKLTGQILSLAPGKNDAAKVIVAGGPERQHAIPVFDKFGRDPTFDYGCCRVADVDQHIMDCFGYQMNIPQNDAGTVRRNKFLPRQGDSFTRQACLSVSNDYQTESENSDCDRRQGRDSAIVFLKEDYNQPETGENLLQERGHLISLVFLAILVALPIIGWFAARDR